MRTAGTLAIPLLIGLGLPLLGASGWGYWACSVILLAMCALLLVVAGTTRVQRLGLHLTVRSIRGSKDILMGSGAETQVKGVIGTDRLLELTATNGTKVTLPLGLFSTTDRERLCRWASGNLT